MIVFVFLLFLSKFHRYTAVKKNIFIKSMVTTMKKVTPTESCQHDAINVPIELLIRIPIETLESDQSVESTNPTIENFISDLKKKSLNKCISLEELYKQKVKKNTVALLIIYIYVFYLCIIQNFFY